MIYKEDDIQFARNDSLIRGESPCVIAAEGSPALVAMLISWSGTSLQNRVTYGSESTSSTTILGAVLRGSIFCVRRQEVRKPESPTFFLIFALTLWKKKSL
jgi:hypothetical protein